MNDEWKAIVAGLALSIVPFAVSAGHSVDEQALQAASENIWLLQAEQRSLQAEPVPTIRLAGQFKAPIAAKSPRVPVKFVCPSGWKVEKYHRDNGAFSCVPKTNTAPLKCPPNTVFYKTKCEIGCRPVIK